MRFFSLIITVIPFFLISCSENTTGSENNDKIPPVISKIAITHFPTKQDTVFRGDIDIELECESYDNDGFIADYIWETTGGTIRGAANYARWDAPTGLPGIYYVICTVVDNDENTARKEFAVDVFNRNPIIIRIEIYPGSFGEHNPNLTEGTEVQFITFIENPEGDDHQWKHVLPDTTTDWMWQVFFWNVPANLPFTNTVYTQVKDEYGAVSTDSLIFYVN